MNTSHANPLNRPWEQLKAEKAGQRPGFVYIGKGHESYPLSDIFGADVWSPFDDTDPEMESNYEGISSSMEYWTTEKAWNKFMTTLAQPQTDSPKGDSEIYQRFFETKKEKAYAIFEETVPGEEGTDSVSIVTVPGYFVRKAGVRGMFVARRNNKGQIVVGYSLCNPKDSFNKIEGLNTARRRCVPYDSIPENFGPGRKYTAEWDKFLVRVKNYFGL